MKRFLLSMLLALGFLIPAMAQETKVISVDFKPSDPPAVTPATPGLPTSATTSPTTYHLTDADHDITLYQTWRQKSTTNGHIAFKKNSTDAYISFAGIEGYAVSSVKLTNGTYASTSVKVIIGSNEIGTVTFKTANTESQTVTVPETQWIAGEAVKIQTNKSSNQITVSQFEITYTKVDGDTPPETPVLGDIVATPAAGEIVKGEKVELSCANATKIEYSFDGTNYTEYTEGVEITKDCTLYVKATNPEAEVTEKTAEFVYTVVKPVLGDIVATPASGEIAKGSKVQLSCVNATAIEYSFDGETYLAYTEGVVIEEACTLYVKASNPEAQVTEKTAQFEYTVKLEVVFDFTVANAYGLTKTDNSNNTYQEGDIDCTEGDVTLSLSGRYRLWHGSSVDLRLYTANDDYTVGTMTVSVPFGYKIKNVDISYSNNGSFSTNDDDLCTWIYTTTKNAYVKTVTVEYEPYDRATPELSFGTDKLNAILLPTASYSQQVQGLPEGVTATYTSSDENVATVDAEGNLTLVGAGTTTITASNVETCEYLSATASYTLVVEPLKFIVKIDGVEVELEEDEEGMLPGASYLGMVDANLGQTMTIETNLGDEVQVMVMVNQSEPVETPITFTESGHYQYWVMAMGADEVDPEEAMPLGALIIDVDVKEPVKFTVKIDDVEVLLMEDEGTYFAVPEEAFVGQTMTITTNREDEVMLLVMDDGGNMYTSSIEFTKPGATRYMVSAFAKDADPGEDDPLAGLVIIVEVKENHVAPETLYLHVKEVGGTFAFEKAVKMTPLEENGKFTADVNIGTKANDNTAIIIHYVFTTHIPAAQSAQGAPLRAAAADHWATLTEGHVFHDGESSKVNAADVTAESDLTPFVKEVSGGKNKFVVDVTAPLANATIERTGVVTGIENVLVEDATEAVYFDLTGRRVAKPANGMYIRVVNGKATKVAIR